ncbi:hypothetical protein B0H13DRAFT_2278430 [Mycena leptocephala]|nr:hypothetical protein B0H13DRAFT_2278430 [Mycena leptocephala]
MSTGKAQAQGYAEGAMKGRGARRKKERRTRGEDAKDGRDEEEDEMHRGTAWGGGHGETRTAPLNPYPALVEPRGATCEGDARRTRRSRMQRATCREVRAEVKRRGIGYGGRLNDPAEDAYRPRSRRKSQVESQPHLHREPAAEGDVPPLHAKLVVSSCCIARASVHAARPSEDIAPHQAHCGAERHREGEPRGPSTGGAPSARCVVGGVHRPTGLGGDQRRAEAHEVRVVVGETASRAWSGEERTQIGQRFFLVLARYIRACVVVSALEPVERSVEDAGRMGESLPLDHHRPMKPERVPDPSSSPQVEYIFVVGLPSVRPISVLRRHRRPPAKHRERVQCRPPRRRLFALEEGVRTRMTGDEKGIEGMAIETKTKSSVDKLVTPQEVWSTVAYSQTARQGSEKEERPMVYPGVPS